MGWRRASLPYMSASATAPSEAASQPMIVTLPTVARVAGRRKMPEPIMLPATTTVARTGPSLRWPATNYSRAHGARPAGRRWRGLGRFGDQRAQAPAEAAQAHLALGERPDTITSGSHA